MTQSEFEKRLKKGLPDYFEQTDNNNFITWMLAEAKNEFPPYAQKVLHNPKFKGGWKMSDLKDWFEKWFGDSDEV